MGENLKFKTKWWTLGMRQDFALGPYRRVTDLGMRDDIDACRGCGYRYYIPLVLPDGLR